MGLSEKQKIADPKLESISLSRQCKLLGISRSHFYYSPVKNEQKEALIKRILQIHEEIPIYGEKKVHRQLLEEGFGVSLNSVSKYRKELGVKAILAVRPISRAVSDGAHLKYPYKLRDIEISRANQVWSADITYIKINGGTVYLSAIIVLTSFRNSALLHDWYSKAVLSWQISNCMDTSLVMGVLNEAVTLYGKPEIFNTDQGSQYTSYIHTQTLANKGIVISMDSKGRATDNIAIERFWRSAKCERVYLNEYSSIRELKGDVKEYIEFYNHKRFHETLEYRKPMNVYYESLSINSKKFDALGKKVG